MAMTVPVLLYIIWMRPSSPMMPSATSASLITPWLCRSTIQLVVRTSSDVQNGSSTRIIRRFDLLSGSVASRLAIG